MQAPKKTTTTPEPPPEEEEESDNSQMIMGMVGGFSCFVGLIILLCILWAFCCGKFFGTNKAKVMPMDFRKSGGGGEKESDSTCSRRQLTEARADCR